MIVDDVIRRSRAAGANGVVTLRAGAGGSGGNHWLGAQAGLRLAIHKAQVGCCEKWQGLALDDRGIIGANGEVRRRDVAAGALQDHVVIVATIAIIEHKARVHTQAARPSVGLIKALREARERIACYDSNSIWRSITAG